MNRLSSESSPYLLQHAQNPVDWYPWGDAAFDKAKEENKLVILSIGYAACHWCHVMEDFCFKDAQIAALMNQHFVSVKVDREERPDIDHLYMAALQNLGIPGGWPLNLFLAPANRQVFYGGTYFKPELWVKTLRLLAEAYQKKPAEVYRVTEAQTHILKQNQHHYFAQKAQISNQKIKQNTARLSETFDTESGGIKGSQKFPMPSLLGFLLQYAQQSGDKSVQKHVFQTLNRMALGGIYDQVGGGFYRYSTDSDWFAPHFEKMLYDNAQLVSLYLEAYNISRNPDFLNIAEETIAFLYREMFDPSCGGFNATIDADSEGEEGKFYLWTYQELQKLIPKADFPLFRECYNPTPEGNWQKDKNILYKTKNENHICQKYNFSYEILEKKQKLWKNILLKERNKRTKPTIDDKKLAAWNGLMLKALAEAYMLTGKQDYLEKAQKLATFLDEKLVLKGTLHRVHKNNKTTLKGYLDDYAALVGGYYALYQANFEIRWIDKARQLIDYVLAHFADEKNPLLYFTDKNAEQLFLRKKEVFDDVIPSSNALIASNLYHLGLLLNEPGWVKKAEEMLAVVGGISDSFFIHLSHWAKLAITLNGQTAEIIIVGQKAHFAALELRQIYLPNKIIVASEKGEEPLDILAHKNTVEGKTTFYICFNEACQAPVCTIEEALEIIEHHTQKL